MILVDGGENKVSVVVGWDVIFFKVLRKSESPSLCASDLYYLYTPSNTKTVG